MKHGFVCEWKGLDFYHNIDNIIETQRMITLTGTFSSMSSAVLTASSLVSLVAVTMDAWRMPEEADGSGAPPCMGSEARS